MWITALLSSPDFLSLTFKRVGHLLQLTTDGSVNDRVADNNFDPTNNFWVHFDTCFNFFTKFTFKPFYQGLYFAVRRFYRCSNLCFEYAFILRFELFKGLSHFWQQGQTAILHQQF